MFSVEELPQHNHEAVVTATDGHTHEIPTGYNTNNPYTMVSTQAHVNSVKQKTDTSGQHAHIVKISNTGGNKQHENRMPYTVVQMWKRTI